MSRTIEIAFGWGKAPGPWAMCEAWLHGGPPRRPGEVIQSLEITGIEPQHVETIEVICNNVILFQSPMFGGGEYLAYMCSNMGLGSTMTVQFHAPGAELARGAAIERTDEIHVTVQLNGKAPAGAPLMLAIMLEEARYLPEPFLCPY